MRAEAQWFAFGAATTVAVGLLLWWAWWLDQPRQEAPHPAARHRASWRVRVARDVADVRAALAEVWAPVRRAWRDDDDPYGGDWDWRDQPPAGARWRMRRGGDAA